MIGHCPEILKRALPGTPGHGPIPQHSVAPIRRAGLPDTARCCLPSTGVPNQSVSGLPILPLQSRTLRGILSAELLRSASYPMIIVGQIKKGAYFDSVTLMRVGKELAGLPGVADAAIVMGTKSNKAILHSSGLLISKFDEAGDTDLLLAVKARTQPAADTALASVDGLFTKATRKAGTDGEARPSSLAAALKVLPEANLAIVSVAGRYAGDVARSVLESGLHVMLFSDNVSLETEIALKKFA